MKYFAIIIICLISCDSTPSERRKTAQDQMYIDSLYSLQTSLSSVKDHFLSVTDSARRLSTVPIIRAENDFGDSLISIGYCTAVRISWPYPEVFRLEDSVTGEYLRPYCLEINNPQVEAEHLADESKKQAKVVNEQLVKRYVTDQFDAICFSYLYEKSGVVKDYYYLRKNL